MKNPCIDCERKGCGSYHDECPEHKKWKEAEQQRRGVWKPSGREFIKETTFRSRVKKRCGREAK